MTILPDCEKCGGEITEPYKVGTHIFCSTKCALEHYRNEQAERLNYRRTVYHVPDEKAVQAVRMVC
jgi:hypothetical protein